MGLTSDQHQDCIYLCCFCVWSTTPGVPGQEGRVGEGHHVGGGDGGAGGVVGAGGHLLPQRDEVLDVPRLDVEVVPQQVDRVSGGGRGLDGIVSTTEAFGGSHREHFSGSSWARKAGN